MSSHSDTDNDDFLTHVFPGASAAAIQFRREILYLNQYCQRFKGAAPSILLTGESGVGKNYTARAISAHSQWLTLTDDERHELFYDRAGRITLPAVTLVDRLLFKEHLRTRGSKAVRVPRLATILGPQLADDLAGSELFGHRKHSFTGADDDHPGIFGDTAVDDVLLDEVGDLSRSIQAKLLQFLETRTFRPVGGIASDERTSEHRLFLATNRSLEALVQSGDFREDLYRRVQGYGIYLPPLRERRDTLPDLAYSMLRSVNQRQRGDEQFGPALEPATDQYCLLPEKDWPSKHPHKSSWVIELTREDLQWCQSYDWPGNVRELRQRLDLYVYRNGHRRLKDVMPQERVFVRPPGATTREEAVESFIGRAVHVYLARALAGEVPAPGQPQKLLAFFQQLVKQAVYRYKLDNRLNKDDLGVLFPDAQDAVTTVGRWKPDQEVSDDK